MYCLQVSIGSPVVQKMFSTQKVLAANACYRSTSPLLKQTIQIPNPADRDNLFRYGLGRPANYLIFL